MLLRRKVHQECVLNLFFLVLGDMMDLWVFPWLYVEVVQLSSAITTAVPKAIRITHQNGTGGCVSVCWWAATEEHRSPAAAHQQTVKYPRNRNAPEPTVLTKLLPFIRGLGYGWPQRGHPYPKNRSSPLPACGASAGRGRGLPLWMGLSQSAHFAKALHLDLQAVQRQNSIWYTEKGKVYVWRDGAGHLLGLDDRFMSV